MQLLTLNYSYYLNTEGYLERCKKSMMEFFAQIAGFNR